MPSYCVFLHLQVESTFRSGNITRKIIMIIISITVAAKKKINYLGRRALERKMRDKFIQQFH